MKSFCALVPWFSFPVVPALRTNAISATYTEDNLKFQVSQLPTASYYSVNPVGAFDRGHRK